VSYIVAVHAEVGRAMQAELLIAEFEDGRTDLVGPLLEAGVPANFQNQHGVSLIQTCAYYGDVSAMRWLLARGASLQDLGPNLGLSTACFHAIGGCASCCLNTELTLMINRKKPKRRHSMPPYAAPTAFFMTEFWRSCSQEEPIQIFRPRTAL